MAVVVIFRLGGIKDHLAPEAIRTDSPNGATVQEGEPCGRNSEAGRVVPDGDGAEGNAERGLISSVASARPPSRADTLCELDDTPGRRTAVVE